MATSSIKKNFIITEISQAEAFANAVETSYQESLSGTPTTNITIRHLRGVDDIKDFMAKRVKADA